MPEITLVLTVSSFMAGILMFLAPCTLPLVPAYLAFIGGVKNGENKNEKVKKLILKNGLAFVLGLTIIFTGFGILAGFFGSFVGPFRGLLAQIGGGLIILFGLIMLGIVNFSVLTKEHKLPLPSFIEPGHPSSAFMIGGVFALGWTPCVGPILATVLLLATTSGTVLSGGFLLFIFSLGLALPFLLTALLYEKTSHFIYAHAGIAATINRVGGVFLVLLGFLLLTDNFVLMVAYGTHFFNLIGFSGLFELY